MNNMELLSPAGNLLQAQQAIAAGCNALYGGVKSWNARNRAQNFSAKDYETIISLCHQYSVKFYLTLNTLVTDHDIREIVDFFSCAHASLPDAFIVADIGLLEILHENFPQTPIHVSTQGGTATVEDAIFYEKMGAARVILARELRLHEIKTIKTATNLELEVFVYGSQCVGFSGQCLWGGLLHGCSGNRGRCIGMCRDIYSNGDNLGNFFYPRDLNAQNCIKQLLEIGIRSIKIEGRMRPAHEIFAITKQYHDLLSHVQPENGIMEYSGFLGEQYPPPQMFSMVNERIKNISTSVNVSDPHDLLIVENPVPQKRRYQYALNANNPQACYYRTLFTRPLSSVLPNISLKVLHDSEMRISGFDYINRGGERKIISFETPKTNAISIKDLYALITDNVPANVYDFTSDIPANDIVVIPMDELVKKFKHLICGEKVCYESEQVTFDPSKDTCSLSSISQLRLACEYGFTNFFIQWNGQDFFDLVEKQYANMKISWVVPAISYGESNSSIISHLVNKKQSILLSRFTQLEMIPHDYQYEIILGHGANIWNSESIEIACKKGVSSAFISPELPLHESIPLFQQAGIKPCISYWGRLPLAISRGCFKSLAICNQRCDGRTIRVKNTSKDYWLYVYCNHRFDTRTIVPEMILFSGNNTQNSNRNISFVYHDIDEMRNILQLQHSKKLFFTKNIYV